jgi:hypothetical protein
MVDVVDGGRRQVRTSFFEKKEAKKLLVLETVSVKSPVSQYSKSFLVTFFQKSNFFLLPSLKAVIS